MNTVEQFVVMPKNTAQEVLLLNLMRTHVKKGCGPFRVFS